MVSQIALMGNPLRLCHAVLAGVCARALASWGCSFSGCPHWGPGAPPGSSEGVADLVWAGVLVRGMAFYAAGGYCTLCLSASSLWGLSS